MKLLVWGDSPTATTGFGRVNREIISGIYKKFNFDVVWLGINYDGDPHDLPFKIYPAIRFLDSETTKLEPWGFEFLEKLIIKELPDIIFIKNDPWNITQVADNLKKLNEFLKTNVGKQFVTIVYFAIDGEVFKDWMLAMKDFDFLVTYTNWAKDLCVAQLPELKNKIEVIPIGVDCSKFFNLHQDKDKLKKLTFGIEKKPVFTIVSRNTQRKQLGLALEALKILKNKKLDAFLYIHANPIEMGYNLYRLANKLNLEFNKDYMLLNKDFAEHKGFDDKILNQIYNASDCVLSTSVGEGWGMSMFEAAATENLLLLPSIRPLTDLWVKKALFYKTSGHVLFPYDLERLREIPDIYDLADKMELIIKSKPNKFDNLKVEAARFAAKFDWSIIIKKWEKIFELAVKKSKELNKNYA